MADLPLSVTEAKDHIQQIRNITGVDGADDEKTRLLESALGMQVVPLQRSNILAYHLA